MIRKEKAVEVFKLIKRINAKSKNDDESNNDQYFTKNNGIIRKEVNEFTATGNWY